MYAIRSYYGQIYLQHGLFHNLGIPWIGAKIFGPTLSGVRTIRAMVAPLGAVGFYFFILMLTNRRILPALVFVLLAGYLPISFPERSVITSYSIHYTKLYEQLFSGRTSKDHTSIRRREIRKTDCAADRQTTPKERN